MYSMHVFLFAEMPVNSKYCLCGVVWWRNNNNNNNNQKAKQELKQKLRFALLFLVTWRHMTWGMSCHVGPVQQCRGVAICLDG